MWALAREWWGEDEGGAGPAQLHMMRRAGLSDDTLETTAAVTASSAMTFLIWVAAVTAHDAASPAFICWGMPDGTTPFDPGVMVRFNPASSDRIEATIGRAGVSNQATAVVPLPGGATDITTLSNFLVWLTIDGATARVGIGDPADGNVSAPTAITGGVDTGSTTVASLFGRNGTTARGLAATLSAGVMGEVLSDAAIAAAAALGASGPATAVAASSAPLWCPRPAPGIVDAEDLDVATDIVDAAGVQSHALTAGAARLKAAA